MITLKNNFYTFVVCFFLSILAFSSCSKTDGLSSLPCQIEKTPAGEEAGISSWPANVYVFSSGKCSYAGKLNHLYDLSSVPASGGDVVSVIAYEDDSNIGLSSMQSGLSSEMYNLSTLDAKGISPQVWISTMTLKSGAESVAPMLNPFTSKVSLNIENAPESFESAEMTIEDGSNTVVFSPFSLSDSDLKVTTKVEAGKPLTVFPMLETDGEWSPQVKVNIAGTTIIPKVTLPSTIGVGEDISISVDLLDFTNKSYSVSWTVTDIATGKVKASSSESFIIPEKLTTLSYRVFVKQTNGWKEVSVRRALCSNAARHTQIWNDWGNTRALRDTMSYCLIEDEFDGPIDIRVEKPLSTYSEVEVRPTTYGIETKNKTANAVEFTIPSYDKRKVSVEFDGDRQHNLFIYVNKPDPDKPTESSANVKYYGPGVHEAGKITLTAGQTLYIDSGAIVYGNVVTNGSNVTIAGNGILSGEKMKHYGDESYSWGDFLVRCNSMNGAATNLKIKDVTFIDGPGWNLCISKTDGVLIDNINIISWELNGDGIDILSSKNVEIKNSFIRTYDDCITLKCRFIVNPIQDLSDVNIHDCLIWADYARGIVIGPEAGNLSAPGYIHDVTVSDCIFLQHARGYTDDLRAAFAIGQGSDGSSSLWNGTNPPRPITDITAKNLIFDNISTTGRNVSIRQYDGSVISTISRVNLENFIVINSKTTYPALSIYTHGNKIENLKIINFTVNGRKLTGLEDQFTIDDTTNVDYSVL